MTLVILNSKSLILIENILTLFSRFLFSFMKYLRMFFNWINVETNFIPFVNQMTMKTLKRDLPVSSRINNVSLSKPTMKEKVSREDVHCWLGIHGRLLWNRSWVEIVFHRFTTQSDSNLFRKASRCVFEMFWHCFFWLRRYFFAITESAIFWVLNDHKNLDCWQKSRLEEVAQEEES